MFRGTIEFTILVTPAAVEKWLLHMNMHIILLFSYQPTLATRENILLHWKNTDLKQDSLIYYIQGICYSDCIFLCEGYKLNKEVNEYYFCLSRYVELSSGIFILFDFNPTRVIYICQYIQLYGGKIRTKVRFHIKVLNYANVSLCFSRAW